MIELFGVVFVLVLVGVCGVVLCWVELEGYGCEVLFDDVDVSCMIGWLMSYYLVMLLVEEMVCDMLCVVKDMLCVVLYKGFGFGVFVYYGDVVMCVVLVVVLCLCVMFNYFG